MAQRIPVASKLFSKSTGLWPDGPKQLLEPMMTYRQLDTINKLWIKIQNISYKKISFENSVCKMLSILLRAGCVKVITGVGSAAVTGHPLETNITLANKEPTTATTG